jgi:hypothetical protein
MSRYPFADFLVHHGACYGVSATISLLLTRRRLWFALPGAGTRMRHVSLIFGNVRSAVGRFRLPTPSRPLNQAVRGFCIQLA